MLSLLWFNRVHPNTKCSHTQKLGWPNNKPTQTKPSFCMQNVTRPTTRRSGARVPDATLVPYHTSTIWGAVSLGRGGWRTTLPKADRPPRPPWTLSRNFQSSLVTLHTLRVRQYAPSVPSHYSHCQRCPGPTQYSHQQTRRRKPGLYFLRKHIDRVDQYLMAEKHNGAPQSRVRNDEEDDPV